MHAVSSGGVGVSLIREGSKGVQCSEDWEGAGGEGQWVLVESGGGHGLAGSEGRFGSQEG